MGGAQAQADWLDSYCWRCGSDDAEPSGDDLLLCAPCRRHLFERSHPSIVTQVSLEVRWQPDSLDRCWRCMRHPVEPDDDVGLCTECRELLARS